MRLYADHPAVRTRQLAADLGLLVWAVLWVLVARVVHGAVLVLDAPGLAVADLGRSISDSMGTAARVADGTPLVGDELAAPFGALSDAGSSVTGAGQDASDAVHTLAAVLAVVLVLLPVGWLLLRWLPWRLGWLREARATDQLLGGVPDLDLLAARALATAPLPQLARLPAGTGAGWRAGDPAALHALAGLELDRLGLRRSDGDQLTG
ncbi:hypothetical protein GCM10023328_44460 [Modestobacter marinus]|uniref:Transmembrane protein n=1 Tax=Modestobacter marinus TaxID=477641 RepID=A0A846LV35_9ACTN|nr:hypothetical protein [Modestobacter marinus]NIH69348.1 hypothetical protein [Modestobacter marinus]GGL82891.1 hypothetical protein GCM10011589_44120 [Modestobacter marinus]